MIFDQSVGLTFGADFSEQDFGPTDFGPQQLADDFKLRSGANTITDVQWWGLYGNTNTPATDLFKIRIFEDDNGSPASSPVFDSFRRDVGRVDTGIDQDDLNVFAYSVDIAPLTLAANTTYWLSIVNVNFINFDWLWNDEGFDENSVFQREDSDPWFPWGPKMGFQLTNDALAVPEPATWALFAAGLAGLGLMNRRRETELKPRRVLACSRRSESC